MDKLIQFVIRQRLLILLGTLVLAVAGVMAWKTLPIDAIKIDRSYIRSLAHDEVARVFVSALAQIAHIQHLIIVAEGVETEDELLLAKAAGCNRFQGYHICRPAPKDKLAAFFVKHDPVAMGVDIVALAS